MKTRNVILNQDVILAISKGFNKPTWKVAQSISLTSREREHVKIRQIYAYIRVVYDDISLTEVGNEMGGFDHSTIIHSKNEIQNQMDINSFDGRVYKQCCLFHANELKRSYKTTALNDSVQVFTTLQRLLKMEDLSSQRTKIRIQIEKLKNIITLLSNEQEENEQEKTIENCA